jgi:hypothetical protein
LPARDQIPGNLGGLTFVAFAHGSFDGPQSETNTGTPRSVPFSSGRCQDLIPILLAQFHFRVVQRHDEVFRRRSSPVVCWSLVPNYFDLKKSGVALGLDGPELGQ